MLGGIGDFLGSAVDVAIGAVEQHVNELIDDPFGHILESAITGGPLGNLALDLIEEATGVDPLAELGEAFSDVAPFMEDVVDIVTAGSLGSMLNVAMDKCGLPDWVGDVAGGVLDAATGNYVGAAANGLDALEDVAKACGGDEIAGFLKMGSQVTGMFAGGGIGQLGAAGAKAADVLGKAGETLKMVDAGIGAAEKFEQGDYLGAATGVLDMAGADIGEASALLGVDASEFGPMVGDITTLATEGCVLAHKALEDGEIDVDDLGVLLESGLLVELGAELPVTEHLPAGLREPAMDVGVHLLADMLGGESLRDAAGAAMRSIAVEAATSLQDAALAQLQVYLDEVLSHVDFGANASAQAREVVDGLLDVAVSLAADIDMGARQGQHLRI